jgi:sec-independent protein translocase protein TatC
VFFVENNTVLDTILLEETIMLGSHRLPRSQNAFREAPILDHLEELRVRLIYAVAFWVAGSVGAYALSGKLLEFLKRPLDAFIASGREVHIVSLSVTEPLVTVFQVALFGGLIVALPAIAYQVWAFVAPGLTRTERRWAVPFVLGLGFSFLVGVAFAYLVILPYAIPFLLGFLDGVENFLSVGAYITQMVTYMAVFGLVFELPITLFLLTKVGLVNARLLSGWRRPAVVAITAISAVITPTADPVNLALMAVPLYVLYEIGILMSRLAGKGQVSLESK